MRIRVVELIDGEVGGREPAACQQRAEDEHGLVAALPALRERHAGIQGRPRSVCRRRRPRRRRTSRRAATRSERAPPRTARSSVSGGGVVLLNPGPSRPTGASRHNIASVEKGEPSHRCDRCSEARPGDTVPRERVACNTWAGDTATIQESVTVTNSGSMHLSPSDVARTEYADDGAPRRRLATPSPWSVC